MLTPRTDFKNSKKSITGYTMKNVNGQIKKNTFKIVVEILEIDWKCRETKNIYEEVHK